jgi:hypothetical protein
MHNHAAEVSTTYSYDIKKNGKPEMVSALEIVAANTDPPMFISKSMSTGL